MADPNIKIQITADDKASGKLKDLDAQVGKTGGGMSTLQKAAVGGAAALVAVGVKSVLAFEDLGLTVGKFADATGTTKEQASRLIEVADDMGISSETLSSSIGKMSKQLGANADAFKAYGIEVKKGANGQTDVNETFLAAVDTINKIQDPLKKAEVSAKVFGKGYQAMSELLGESSSKIRTDLAAVESQKIFDDKKVESARDMRKAFDSIVDSGQDLLYTIGGALAPAISELAPILVKVIKAAGPLAESIGKTLAAALQAIEPIITGLLPLINLLAKALTLVSEAIGHLKPTMQLQPMVDLGVAMHNLHVKADAAGMSTDQFNAALERARGEVVPTGDKLKDAGAAAEIMGKHLDVAAGSFEHMGITAQDTAENIAAATATSDELTGSFEHGGVAAQDNAAAVREQARATAQAAVDAGAAQRATDNLKASWDALKGSLSDQQAWIGVQNSFDDVKQKGIDAMDAAKNHTADAEQKARDYQDAMLGLRLKVIDYAAEVGGLPVDVVTMIQAEVDNGSLATANQLLDEIAHQRQVIYNAQVGDHREFKAKGGPVSAGHGYIVGEEGPEAFIPAGNGTIVPAGQTAAMMAGSSSSANTFHITVNGVTDPIDISKAVAREVGWRLRAT